MRSPVFLFRYLFPKKLKNNIPQMSVFVMNMNPIVGKKEWAQKPEYYDYYQEVARSSYADMLHDEERNKKYFEAIKKAIQTMKEQGRKTKVLDIGTGTGLLSMMAARSGADIITACEVFRPVAKCAENVIKENGFENKVHIIQKHSTDLTVGADGDLKEKANILVAEVFDTELIGEGALKTFQHALKNLLEPNSIVIPSAACIYAQIIESPFLTKWNNLSPITIGTEMCILPPAKAVTCPGSASVHDLQMSQIPKDKFDVLSEPVCVFEFSFTDEKSLEMNETCIKQVQALQVGICGVVFMWWELKMDMKGDIMLNNGPSWVQPNSDKAQWRDHWMQALYYLPELILVSKGEEIAFTACHDEFSLWFAVSKTSVRKCSERPTCSCLVHVTDSHARIGMKNDSEINYKYVTWLKETISPSSICLCISDGSLLPLMAAKMNASKVFTVEPNHLQSKMIKSYIEANNLTNIKVIEKDPTDINKNDLEEEKIEIFIAEPYFTNCIRPWELMRFWHLNMVFKPFFANNVKIVPQIGKLKAVAVDFKDLWKIRAPVQNAESFNLSKFDEIVQRAMNIADASIEPQPLWEYPCTALSEPFEVFNIDFSKISFSENFKSNGQTDILCPGICNAVALWTEYNYSGTKISLGPTKKIIPGEQIDWYMNCQQGVYFLQPPIVVDSKNVLSFEMDFKLSGTTFSFTIN